MGTPLTLSATCYAHQLGLPITVTRSWEGAWPPLLPGKPGELSTLVLISPPGEGCQSGPAPPELFWEMRNGRWPVSLRTLLLSWRLCGLACESVEALHADGLL